MTKDDPDIRFIGLVENGFYSTSMQAGYRGTQMLLRSARHRVQELEQLTASEGLAFKPRGSWSGGYVDPRGNSSDGGS